MIKEIKTQEELDAHVDGDDFTELRIICPFIIIRKSWANSRAVLRDNSRAELWANSSAELRDNSSADLWENSRAELWDNSSAELRDNSRADLWANSTSSVFSKFVEVCANNNSVVIMRDGCDQKVKKAPSATVIKKKKWKHTKESFLDIYKDRGDNGSVILYKSVNPKTMCDFYTGKIKYDGVVKCPDWDDDEERECGRGFHLSPTPSLALSFNQGTVLKCEVAIENFVVFSANITKVRCKKVRVIGVYEDKK